MGFLAPALGAIGEAAGTAGSAIGSAAGTVGSALESAMPTLSKIVPGLSPISDLASGVSNIVKGAGAAGAPSEAGYLASLGQAVPEGVDIVGPSPTFAGPGFLGGFAQGFTGAAQKYANPSAATSVGTGVGQLFDALTQMRGGGGLPGVPQPQTQWEPLVKGIIRKLQGPEVAPAATPPAKPTAPIMSMLAGLFQGF